MLPSRGAIILCGGASQRMGRDKALLPFGDKEVLLQRVVRLLSELVPLEHIVCVAADEQLLPQLPESLAIVRDAAPHQGPLVGLAAGMAVLGEPVEVVFGCGCDTPLLVPQFVGRMFDRVAGFQIAVPDADDRVHPLAAVYRTDVLPIAETLLLAGERSLVSLLERCETRRVLAEELRDVDPVLSSLRGCNTPEEYQRLLVERAARS